MATDHDLATLNTLAQALSRSVDLAAVLQAALDTVAELLALDTGWVWLLDEETGAPHLAATRHLPPGLVRRPQLMEGPCYCLTTYEAGDLRGAANVNVVGCSRLAQLVDDADGLRCHASIPLYADGRKLGILNVASRDWRELSRDELDLLYTVGALVSLAVERTRLADTRSQLAAVEERNRLAREIHDTLAQSLAAITMQLETADALAERAGAASLRGAVSHALALTRATLEEARRSVLDLRSAPLDRRTLAAALRTLGNELHAAAGAPLAIDVVWEGSEDGLPAAVEIGLYRIAREALTNVMRHAGTTSATVRVAREPGHVRMRIEDRGAGFDASRVPPGRFGLVGMSERARLFGGTLRVESAPGRGTNIVVEVPVRSGAAARAHA
jgi:two-component system NarL family sensor kinase